MPAAADPALTWRTAAGPTDSTGGHHRTGWCFRSRAACMLPLDTAARAEARPVQLRRGCDAPGYQELQSGPGLRRPGDLRPPRRADRAPPARGGEQDLARPPGLVSRRQPHRRIQHAEALRAAALLERSVVRGRGAR